MDSLYRFNLDVKVFESMFPVENHVVIMRSAPNESLAFLWHQKLNHISKEKKG